MSRRRRKKWPFLLILVAALSGGGWWWYTNHHTVQDLGPEYETTTVNRGEITKVVSATGELNPLVKVEIGSQISGTITTLNVDFNAKVKAGDILCQLDPATYEAAYSQTQADEASARAALELQQRTLERKTLLLKREFFAQADYDKARSDLAQAEAAVQLAEARVKKAKVDLDRCTIFAPIDGVIVDRTAEIGQTIAASFNAPKLFVVANDLTKMQINAKISEADIGQLSLGQTVRFNVDAYPDNFNGEVVQVRNSPIKEENVVNYDAIIAVNNPDLKLKPGMNATVYITTGERKDVLRIPNAAFRFQPPAPTPSADGPASGPPAGPPPSSLPTSAKGRSGPVDEKTVYFLPKNLNDPPIPATVKIGLSDGLQTEIMSGLKEGDSLITLLKPPPPESQGMANPFGGPSSGRRSSR